MIDKQIVALLDKAFEQAIIEQFIGLFGVLYVAEDPDLGLERFQRGLIKLLDTGIAVAEVIRTMENNG